MPPKDELTTRAQAALARYHEYQRHLERRRRFERTAFYWLRVLGLLAILLALLYYGARASEPKGCPLLDFIAADMREFNEHLSADDAEMLARACMELPGDPLYWSALMRAESGYRPTVTNSIGCYGVFQINVRAHRARLERLDLDVRSFADQVEFARLLCEERGFQPWNSSRKNTRRYYAELTAAWRERWEGELN